MEYNRTNAVAYAHKWGLLRNPQFYNFDGIGGDCTNFVSQCIYAGAKVMNYTRDVGWYYISSTNRAAAWTSVEYLYRFLTTNKEEGPYGIKCPINLLKIGDIIQLSYDGILFGHSLFVIKTHPEILVAQHSTDENYINRPFSSYSYSTARGIHIEGVLVNK